MSEKAVPFSSRKGEKKIVKAIKDSLKKIIDEVWSRLSPKLAGKADKDHTHPAQTSVSGNAGTATKLKTARKIGNASFDGSADITLAQMGAAASGHTHSNMKAATASAAGAAGLVPAPAAGAQGKYLRGDGTWQTPPNTTYSAATQSANGLLTAADKKKLDGVAANANNYSHPTTAGNKHIPAGGSSGQILRWSVSGTAVWGAESLPITGTLTLTKTGWTQDTTTKLYKQTKTISGLTAKHRVDLDIDYAVEMDLPAAIRPVNNNGSFYAITAEPPTKDITVQYTLILTK